MFANLITGYLKGLLIGGAVLVVLVLLNRVLS